MARRSKEGAVDDAPDATDVGTAKDGGPSPDTQATDAAATPDPTAAADPAAATDAQASTDPSAQAPAAEPPAEAIEPRPQSISAEQLAEELEARRFRNRMHQVVHRYLEKAQRDGNTAEHAALQAVAIALVAASHAIRDALPRVSGEAGELLEELHGIL